MLSSVAVLKESLSEIANAVHDDEDEELARYTPTRQRFDNGTPGSDRRVSGNFSLSGTPMDSPIINQYKSEIKKLQESQSEIKALSVNYAALLKEKEDIILRLTEENGSLKENLITNAAVSASKYLPKSNGDISSARDHRVPAKTRIAGRALNNGTLYRNDGFENALDNAKEFSGLSDDTSTSFNMIKEGYEGQIKGPMGELAKERSNFSSLHLTLQEEQKRNESLQLELSFLKDSSNNMSSDIQKTRDELTQKIIDNRRLQSELQNRDEAYSVMDDLRKEFARLEDENKNVKKEKVDLEAALKEVRSYPARNDSPPDVSSNTLASSVNEDREEMLQRLHKLEKDLQASSLERDKAVKELSRLKQHLLEKESEESEKMDEDSKIIEDLRAISEQRSIQIARLEQALKHALGSQEEMKISHNTELLKSKESIDEVNKKLASCTNALHAKNSEIHNLQMALGQYYAEIEAKERLIEELSAKKEELARTSNQLQDALQRVVSLNNEKQQMLERQSQVDLMLAEGKSRVKKLEGDNEKLHRALEQSMMRLNRMSMDSDFLVDRRIVIKLLVTYFQRSHSKEVLDLMVRMLGFSEEDEQRIGMAQQGTGKGLVRGVLGLPGRLVGGIMSSGSAEANASLASDNQSFADLWVDFLLKETEREKKEAADAQTTQTQSSTTTSTPFINQNQTAFPSHGAFLHRELSPEFSTVPLTSSQSSGAFPRH